MLTNYPLCPACDELGLYRVPGDELRVKCFECGWDSGALAVIVRIDLAAELIAAAVRDERAIRAARGAT